MQRDVQIELMKGAEARVRGYLDARKGSERYSAAMRDLIRKALSKDAEQQAVSVRAA